MIYTFYSYKGGLGRTMALANIAELLYQKGRRVLIVDWDLEAPGLDFYFHQIRGNATQHPGVIDLLLDYKNCMIQDSRENETGEVDLRLPVIESYFLNVYDDKEASGKLSLLSAGKRVGENFELYGQMIRSFDWKGFYNDWAGGSFFEWLRKQLTSLFDVVLVDSRAGLAEMGGICTYHLADVVLMFCGTNQQSIDGTLKMARAFKNPELPIQRNGRPLEFVIIPARVEDRAAGVRSQEFIKDPFAKTFSEFIPKLYAANPFTFYWEVLRLPYIPDYAFGEHVIVKEGFNGHTDLVRAYKSIAEVMELLAKKLGSTPTIQLGHGLGVNAVVFNPKNELLAAGGDDGLISLWRIADKIILTTREAHLAPINTLHFSPDGEMLASGSDDGSIKLWDVQSESDQPLRALSGHEGRVHAVHFSPDGQLLASCGDEKVLRLWETASGRLLHEFKGHEKSINAIHFLPDRDKVRMASGSDDKNVRLWSWSGQGGRTLLVLRGHRASVRAVQFSPDGEFLASGSDDGSMRLWRVKTGETLSVLEAPHDQVKALGFSPNGELLVSVSSRYEIRVYDITKGKLKLLWERQANPNNSRIANALSFSPNGEEIVGGCADHSLRLWKAKLENAPSRLDRQGYQTLSIQLAPSEDKLASGNSDNFLRLWDLKNNSAPRVLEGHAGPIRAVSFSQDGEMLASCSDDRSIRVWNSESGESLRQFTEHQSFVWCVCFSPNKKSLLSGGSDNLLRLWNLENEQPPRVLEGHAYSVRSVHFSSTGERLASGDENSQILLWETSTGKSLHSLSGHASPVSSVHFSPDGKYLASGGDDQEIRLWEVDTGLLSYFRKEHTGPVSAVRFSPDGKILASASHDHTVRLWEVESGQCLHVLKGHWGPVYAISFAPNGKFLVSAGTAGRLQFWDLQEKQVFLYRYIFSPGVWLDLLPDGRFDDSSKGNDVSYLRYTRWETLQSHAAKDLKSVFYDPRAVREVLEKYLS